MRYAELEYRRIAVWGSGREGRAAIAALTRRFPDKLLTWIVPSSEVDALRAEAPDGVVLAEEGGRDGVPGAFEIVVKSPGISLYRADVVQAAAAGTRFTSGTALWFAEHPQARTICVTGTKGKSSTAALIAHVLRASGVYTALAGNIGLPLLALEQLPPAMWHVFELSSFQTADLDAAPTVAVLTSLAEEHLDWHGSAAQYRRDKMRLFAKAQRCVMPARIEMPAGITCEPTRFGLAGGWHVEGGAIRCGDRVMMPLADLPLPGRHNAMNVCAAMTALQAAGFNAAALLPHVKSFRPLPHRLQALGERDGVLYVDDSIATTPAATLAAWACYRHRPVALVLGGHERGLDWRSAAQVLGSNPPRLICTQGTNGPRIAALMREYWIPVAECRDLAAAVSLARLSVSSGGVVLLSPGAPSFPTFRDYTDRGRAFAKCAGFDPDMLGHIEGLGVG